MNHLQIAPKTAYIPASDVNVLGGYVWRKKARNLQVRRWRQLRKAMQAAGEDPL